MYSAKDEFISSITFFLVAIVITFVLIYVLMRCCGGIPCSPNQPGPGHWHHSSPNQTQSTVDWQQPPPDQQN